MNQRIKWPNQLDRGQNGPIKDSGSAHIDSILNSYKIKIEEKWYIDSKICQFPLAPLFLQAYNRTQIAEESLKRANRSERAGRKTTGLTPGHRGMVAGLPSERSASLLASHVRVAHVFGGWKMSTRFRSTELSSIPRLLGWLGFILMCCFTSAVFAGQATLAWDASSSPVSGYRVYYGTASGNYASSVNVGNATTSTVSNLTDGSTYYFAVKAYDSSGNESGFSNEVSQVLAVAAPSTSFSVNTTSGTAPVAVQFTDSSTGSITSRSWDFGDGTTSTLQNPSKTYSSKGTYTVKLTTTGPGGSNTAIKTDYILVLAATDPIVAAPDSSFSATPTSGPAPLLVTLARNSTDTISSRTWDFGDGTTSTAQSIVKTYNTAGTYTVKLTVSNSGGSSTTTKTVSVTTAAPVANFTASPASGVAPLPVTFSNTSTNAVSYSWDFGDGTTDTGQNPSHTYASAGNYTVTLTATGSSGTTPSTKTQTITVSQASANTGGLVAAYNFEEASGNIVVDASGNANHGTLACNTAVNSACTAAARTTKGKFGKAISFDGTDDWVTVNHSASLNLTTGMTLEAWVYPTVLSSWRTVLIKEESVSSGIYSLYANTDYFGTNQPAAVLDTGDKQVVAGGTRLPLNKWTHLAVTYDGQYQRLYVGGTQVAVQPQTGTMVNDTGALRIGGSNAWGFYFQGRIDEVRVYNRALSGAEISTDMNTAVATSSPPKRLLGEEAPGSVSEILPQGTAAAFQTTASVNGMVTSLPVYVDTGSASTKLVAALYNDNNGHPGARIAMGTLSSLVVGWNNIPLPATAVTANTTYWVAILSPKNNGDLKFRDKVGSTVLPSETSKATTLGTLPSTWSTGTVSSNGPLSGYGAGY